MTQFRINQRVRFIGSSETVKRLSGNSPMTVTGDTGTITALSYGGFDRILFGNGLVVKMDNGATFGGPRNQFEPLQPEGAAPSEFKTLADLLMNLGGLKA